MTVIEKIIEGTPGRRLSSDKFYNDGIYRKLRAMATTKEDVGLGDAELLKIITDAPVVKVESSTINLVPVKASAELTYDTDQTFKLTAKANAELGNGQVISFVDPEDISQTLAVALVAGVITITHATDETGAINTAAGDLFTAINNAADVKDLVLATMGDAGTVDFVGQLTTAGYEDAIVCKKGQLLSDGSFIYLVIADCDGINNESTDFKKVALIAL